jgi:hypothetical protein
MGYWDSRMALNDHKQCFLYDIDRSSMGYPTMEQLFKYLQYLHNIKFCTTMG